MARAWPERDTIWLILLLILLRRRLGEGNAGDRVVSKYADGMQASCHGSREAALS